MIESAKKNRIEYIDLAKGFCILLVVFSHLLAYYRTALPYDCVLKCFRMPLYFFLSGVFFKEYENFFGFLKRKLNKLLVPFFFFYIVLGLILPVLLYDYCGVKILGFHPKYGFWQDVWQFVMDEKFPDAAIWFLISLFEVNMIFYAIYKIAKKIRWKMNYVIGALSLLCGVAGMLCSIYAVNLRCFVDTSLTSVPFFALGYIMARHSGMLRKGWRGDRYIWLIVIACIGILFWLAYPLDYRSNYFANCYHTAHIVGVVGTLMTILLAKKIGHIPVVTYWGHYSIMILLTHQIIYQIVHLALKMWIPRGWWLICTNLVVTMTLYFILIPLMRRYMPYVTAQKDILKI